jgi:pyruvate,water dikinase
MLTLAFGQEGSLDTRLVGGKAHGLAFMTAAGVPVAPGFTVTTQSYRNFMETNGLRGRISAIVHDINPTVVTELEALERRVSAWIDEMSVPETLSRELAAAYDDLCRRTGEPNVSVACRSSATAEDAAGTSFAGEYETFVGVRGVEQVTRRVLKCWASAFTARSLAYVLKNGLSPMNIDMAVVVQKTVNAQAAGVMFTLSPLTGDRSRIVIEAAYGLGLSVVGGEVTPDRYVVKKIGLEIAERVIGSKHIEYLTGDSATPVEPARQALFCLRDDELVALAKYGKLLEKQHQRPVDVEFAIDRDLPIGARVVLLQCRPETYWSSRHAAKSASRVDDAASAVAESVQRIGRGTRPAGAPIIEENK